MGKRLSLRDQDLLNRTLRGESPATISEDTGVDTLTVIKRVKDILATRDVFSEIEQRRILVYGLQDLYDRALTFLDSFEFEDGGQMAKMIDSVTKVIDSIDRLQSAQSKISDDELERAAAAQAAKMMQFIQASYQRARELLAEEYPEVDIERIDGAFQEGLREVTSGE